MNRRKLFTEIPLVVMLLSFCFAVTCAYCEENSAPMTDSTMLQEWTGPYGGVPPFHLVRPEQFLGAFDDAIKAARQDIDKIASNPDAPTFENTIVALETAGRPLDRLSTLFDVHSSNLNLGPIPDIERVVEPKLAEYRDSVTQNEKLFARVAAVYNERDKVRSSLAQERLLEDRYKNFVRQGAQLSAEDKAKLSQINQRLARLFTDFSQNLLAEEKGYVTWIEDPS